MPEQELRFNQAKSALPPIAPLLTAAQKQFEALTHTQSELTKKATELLPV